MLRQIKIQLLTQYGVFIIFLLFATTQILLIWNGGPSRIFESPDANVNYHFAVRLAQGLPLGVPSTISQMTEYITPRSAAVHAGLIVPSGFVGLIALYGFLSSFTSINLIPYWTLVFALLGLMHFYWLLKRVFSPQMAWWSVFICMVHPAWLYYTQRSLLPNVLFVSLLLMSSYYIYQISQRRRLWDYVGAGLALSAAVMVRPSEAIWIAVAVISFVVIERRRLFLKYIVATVVSAIPAVVILLFAVMGQWSLLWGGGNQLLHQNPVSLWQTGITLLFPFGFHPRLIWWVIERYVIWWQLPFLVLALIGAASFRQNFREQRHRHYCWLTVFVATFLLCYYGSWLVQDNPVAGATTIGTSYIRYLLPLFTLLSPFVAWAIIGLTRQLAPQYQKIFTVSIVGLLLIISVQRVLAEPQEGWLQQRRDLHSYERVLALTKRVVTPDTIIMTQKGDKYLWPTFAVITPQGDDGYLAATAELVESGYHVVFLNPIIDDERRQFLDRQWQPLGLQLGPAIFERDGLGLYLLSVIRHD